ncbi:LLM class flavin-dependent oxidoreductase [Sulfuriferula sp.]|uniref:LLM class flavin-dependent oxidoreductase n=1 Tax=Sulfuriferula sp. TaxID=2025307 RepID=UPI00272F21B6|nr:LLM class flavin-dependent oxidoreductase [Sulfuriferula sp.]MDP2025669.1 LLM class flavin-dependent oxidoreductase [Sulfuriferula sp.]
MQFDLFYEISQPPHLPRSEAQAYAATLDEIALADQLGFGCAWLVEHHFMRGYSHSSKPDLVLAAASQRTRTIRLGLSVVPLPYHHPVHVAERMATLDILTQGRLEIGIGRGFSPQEYRTFGADMADSRTLTAESLAILQQSFERRPVSFHGKHFQLDQLDILPHPVQTPPPLWTAAVSPDTFTWAAQQQLGMLAGPFKPWMMVKHDIAHYRDAWHGAAAPRTGMTVGIFCLPDGKRARQLAKPALEWFYHELFATTLPVLEKLYPSYEHFHDLGRFRSLMKLGINLTLLETFGMAVVGSPSECIEKLQKYREAGVTNLLCAVGAGALETSVIQESMQCIAEDVMPAFAN